MKVSTLSKNTLPKLLAAGFLAGAVNGLLGAGGGIITVFALTKIYKEKMNDKNAVFAHALCVMLPLSLISTLLYLARGSFSVSGFGVFIIPAVLGGFIGGFLLDKLKATFLNRLFAALVIISGILLIVR